MSPESGYIAQLVRAFVSGGSAATRPPPGLDWERLGRLLQAHGIGPTVAQQIDGSTVPRAFREALALQNHGLHRRGALLGLELTRLLAQLERAGVEPVVLKGLALGRSLYPAPSQRVVSDLDLLVRRDALDAAGQALGKLGYRPADEVRHPQFYAKHHFHLRFRSSAGVLVELHWDLSRPTDYTRFDLDGFFGRARVIEHGGAALRVPADSDQLLHAACQALRRGYADLRRLIDAALLVKVGAAGTPGLAGTAERQGMATAVWVLLNLGRELAGPAVPDAVESALRPRPLVRRCLNSLPLSEVVLEVDAQHDGLRHLLIWLSAPSLGAAASEIRQFLVPGELQLLDEGHDPGRLPGFWRRGALTARHTASLLKIAGFQAWRLARSL